MSNEIQATVSGLYEGDPNPLRKKASGGECFIATMKSNARNAGRALAHWSYPSCARSSGSASNAGFAPTPSSATTRNRNHDLV